jgi:hypothetical protein
MASWKSPLLSSYCMQEIHSFLDMGEKKGGGKGAGVIAMQRVYLLCNLCTDVDDTFRCKRFSVFVAFINREFPTMFVIL